MKKAVCLLSLCLLSACGGGGGDAGGDPIAVSPSPAAPPPASSALDDSTASERPGGGTTSPAAPPSGTAVLATSYPATDMACVQGNPGFWQRSWRIGYEGSAFRLQPLPPPSSGAAPTPAEPAQVLAWRATDVQASRVDGATEFTAPGADGRRATLRVAADGTPIGFAAHGGGGQPLRCGSFAADARLATAHTSRLLCQWVFPANGPIQGPPDLPAYQASVTLDARAFPWAGVTATSDPRLFDDPDGSQVTGSPNRYWSVETDGTVSVYIGPPFSFEGATYLLRDGQVVGIRVDSRSAAGPAQICRPG